MPDELQSALPQAPRLPQKAAIYIAPDGSVKFGALFEDLVPVAAAVAAVDADYLRRAGAAPEAPVQPASGAER